VRWRVIRSTLPVVALTALAVFSVGASAQVVDAPAVSWMPERPAEGELFVVRVTPASDDDVVVIAGEAGPEALHFDRAADGSFFSLAAVPLGEQSAVELGLTFVSSDGGERDLDVQVPVTPGTYNHRQLRVAPELGAPPDPAQQARRARETSMAAEVSASAHRTRRMWTTDIVMPRSSTVTSSFGDGRIFNGQVSSRHTGLDLRGAPGDTVVAPTRGVVAMVETFELAGNNVYINHGGGLVTAYFHLSRQLVAEGDTVEAGTPVGLVGATGRVTGPHLHWVARYGNTSVDPRSLISASREIAAIE
jgi:murein DD-endopeptidase MepM/ murein hydrolase activator NlpD